MGKPTGFLEYARQGNHCQPPLERVAYWNEFHPRLGREERQRQGARGMACGVPFCQSGAVLNGMVSGCPLHNLVPEWNDLVYRRKLGRALERLLKTNDFPEFTGRVCPALCEAACTCGLNGQPVTVKDNELGIIEEAWEQGLMSPRPPETRTGRTVAVVGSGPASLTCASDLAKHGYEVTIFEAFHTAGGVLVYGIPEFRLPKAIVQNEVDKLTALGVDLETDMVIGKTFDIDEMFEEGYEAVFIGSGAGLPMFMGIEGETLAGVYSANEYLTRINLMKAYQEGSETPILHNKKVAVVGGGNVAMDAARCAKRLGAEVHIVYRRSEAELPARAEEVHHAKEEGIIFDLLTNPISIEGDEKGHVQSMTCIRMELGEPDASGRRRPVEIPGSDYTIDVDAVIMSLGTSPNPLISSTTEGLETNRWKCIIADEANGKTTKEGVYAGGDAVTGAATVILAMEAGRAGARGIDEYLNGNK